MDTTHIDIAIDELAARKTEWARLPIEDKIHYLDTIKAHTAQVARSWVEDAVKAKGLSMDSPLAGEEWTSGPYSVLSVIRDLRRTLVRLSDGADLLEGLTVRELPNDRVAVDVFPVSVDDRLLFSGVTGEVRMQEGLTADNLREHLASFYREVEPEGDVCVVLAAGNIASIAVLDVIHAMFNEGKVVILKMNPVNDYLGPHFEDLFADLVSAGFVRFAYGGSDVGHYLTGHPRIDSIHLTGSVATYEAIMFGTGDEGRENLLAKAPVNDKPVSAELGGAGPVIIVPGKWSKADLRFQAEHIVSMRMHNSGFNCVAAQVLIVPDGWDQLDDLLDAIRNVLVGIEDRPPYYPGTTERVEALAEQCSPKEIYGSTHPRYLFTDVPAEDEGHSAFSSEVFGPALAVTRLVSPDVGSYLIKAVRFANEQLVGTLGAVIIVDPTTQRRHRKAIERAIDDLEYGTIAVNLWTGAAYFLSAVAWGAYPGHTPDDIGSGVGFVHNTLMFDHPEKSVVYGGFAPAPRALLKRELHMSPKLVYFVTNRQAHNIGERLVEYAATESKADLARVAAAAIRG